MARLLRDRQLALLWAGMSTSLVGDGIFVVATAWEAYRLSNRPSALAYVGLALTAGTIAFLLVGGITSDRLRRRHVMMAADAVRAVLLATLGALSLTGALELWMLVAVAAVHGAADGFFNPASTALLPDVVAENRLVAVNGLMGASRGVAQRVAGPAAGGAIVGLLGAGGGFVVDAATFAVSLGCVAAMRVEEAHTGAVPAAALDGLRQGFAYVRRQTWLWATLLAATVALLTFYGPTEVLVPFVVKNHLHEGAASYGLFLAALGAGAVGGALWMGGRPLPRRPVFWMYSWWGWGSLPICLLGVADRTWQLALLGFAIGAPMSVGMVVWSTLMQTRVPRDLLGRVSSVDWFVSISLTPLSFALTPPVAAAIGIDWTFVAGGALAAGSTLGILLLVPGLRERREVVREAGIGDGGGVHADDLDALGAGEPGDGPDHGEPVVSSRGKRPSA
jgi:MFS family permease